MASGKDNLGQKLIEIKEELEGKKSQRSESQGELNSLMKQLKECGVETVEQAEELIRKQEKELQVMETEIEEEVEEIENMMEGGGK